MTTFTQKLRQRMGAESEQIKIETVSKRLLMNGDFSDFFLDKESNKFMKFDDTGRAVEVSEFELARIVKHLNKNK